MGMNAVGGLIKVADVFPTLRFSAQLPIVASGHHDQNVFSKSFVESFAVLISCLVEIVVVLCIKTVSSVSQTKHVSLEWSAELELSRS